MAVKIKARGRQASKPTEDEAPKPVRKRKAKPAAKRQPAKRDSTATASKPAAKRGPGRPRKQETQDEKAAPVRRNSTGVDPRAEAKALKLVTKMGERRAKAEAEHKESINALHQAATEAMEMGVSMAKVSDASGISRQWLYKMGDFRGRKNGGNGNGETGTSTTKAPKSTTKPKSTRSTTTRQKQQTKQQTGGSRRRVAIRSAG